MSEFIAKCPVCGTKDFTNFMDVKDYFLSQEEFTIVKCISCGFRFLNPRPTKSEIPNYYQSEKYISHDSKGTDLISRLYKLARYYSVRHKFNIVRRYAQKGKILDIGCGTGEFLNHCRKKGFEVTGVEPNNKAKIYAQSENRIPVEDNLESLQKTPGSFQCITMWHVLEHVHDLHETLSMIKRLLTPDGNLFIAVPNSNSWDAMYYKQFWAAYDAPRHLYHFTGHTLQEIMFRQEFEIKKILPQRLDAFYVSMLSEKYKTGRNNYFKTALLGFWSNFYALTTDAGHSSLIFIFTLKNS